MRISFAIIPVLLSINAAAAQRLECQTFSKQEGGAYGAAVEANARLAEQNLPAGYVVTGGGCSFDGGVGFGYVIWSKLIDGGYSCRAIARGTTEYVIATAQATACRIKRPDIGNDTRNAPFSNVGLGGDAVAIARANNGAVPYSIRICNLRATVMQVELSQTSKQRLKINECLEVDTPQRAFFRTPDSVSLEAFGAYSLFKQGTFPKTASVGLAKEVRGDRVEVGPFKSASASCQKPAPGEPFNASYWGYCKLDALKEKKNYRVCFENGYSNQGDALEYAGGLLRVILDRSLMNRGPVGGQLDPYLYMSVEPTGCRDMHGVTDAFVLVTNNTWNDQAVSKITYRVAEIPPPK